MRRWHSLGEPGVVEAAELAGQGKIKPSEWVEFAACAECFDRLRRDNPETIEAVREVYMAGSGRGMLKKGEVSARVIHYSIRRYISEREVWRMLTQASAVFDALMTLSGEGERKVFLD